MGSDLRPGNDGKGTVLKLTQHFQSWLDLIQQVGDDIEMEMGYGILDADEFERRMDLRLMDLGQPLNVHDYERLYGSRYEDGESYG